MYLYDTKLTALLHIGDGRWIDAPADRFSDAQVRALHAVSGPISASRTETGSALGVDYAGEATEEPTLWIGKPESALEAIADLGGRIVPTEEPADYGSGFRHAAGLVILGG